MAGEKLVTKVSIIAYKDVTFSSRKGGDDEIELQINPQEISMSFEIDGGEHSIGGKKEDNMTVESAPGESFKPYTFKGYASPDLTIDTIVDATGILPAPKGFAFLTKDGSDKGEPSVQNYIKKLKAVCYDYVTDIHGPAYLAVAWGEVFLTQSNDPALQKTSIFKCTLKSMDVKYTLFSASGLPVRAEVSLKFKGFQDAESRATGNSPDLSHIIEIKYGDNLPALCKKIYGSPDFYLQIARINNLPSVYAIEPGMKLLFPPLDKASR